MNSKDMKEIDKSFDTEDTPYEEQERPGLKTGGDGEPAIPGIKARLNSRGEIGSKLHPRG